MLSISVAEEFVMRVGLLIKGMNECESIVSKKS